MLPKKNDILQQKANKTKKFDQKSVFPPQFPNISNDYEKYFKRHLAEIKYGILQVCERIILHHFAFYFLKTRRGCH